MNIPAAIVELKERGVSVVRGVVPPEKADEYASRLLSDVQEISPSFKPEDPDTWRNRPGYKHGGLLQHFNVGQMHSVWDLRSEEKIIEVFQTAYGEEEMVCSFDGVNISTPPRGNEWTREKEKDWMHFDQSVPCESLPTKCCIQGMVALRDIDEDDCAFECYPGSHKLFEAFRLHKGLAARDNWLKFDSAAGDYKYFEDRGLKREHIPMRKGDMVLWYSSTAHKGSLPKKDRVHKDRWRINIYISMLPAKYMTQADRKKKVDRFNKGQSSFHWPLWYISSPASVPWTRGVELSPELKAAEAVIRNRAVAKSGPPCKDKLTLTQLRLAGVETYPGWVPYVHKTPLPRASLPKKTGPKKTEASLEEGAKRRKTALDKWTAVSKK